MVNLHQTLIPPVHHRQPLSLHHNHHTLYLYQTKTLPFQVDHIFDLHRLEPGYPLFIDGINISHDRGCGAHSNGNIFDSNNSRDNNPTSSNILPTCVMYLKCAVVMVNGERLVVMDKKFDGCSQ
ncbi:hypothetical protein PIB30_006223 [Stylosanthes scabra]|uniref:Uncharacterized protein n=1 Tax=Stylosanthes scabra TaxID=79078 RepID=A0ABU6Z4R2_9FABA|nr:hypothetical protein [Stylosanthes scabra]